MNFKSIAKKPLALVAVTVLVAACGTLGDGGGEPGLVSSGEALIAFDDGSGGLTSDRCTVLYAGQSIDVGTVCVSVDSEADTSASCGAGALGSLVVTYELSGGWELEEAHLAAGTALSDIPTNRKGNPIPGQFPYHSGPLPDGTISYAFELPLCDFGLDASLTECDPLTAYLAAHAVVSRDDGSGEIQTETGWASGDRFVDSGSWGTFFTETLVCYEPDPEDPGGGGDASCETAFAFGGDLATCFIDADFDGDGLDDGFNRWGWSNGAIGPGSYSWDIYAGAGQCDLSKGTLVGTLGVEYDGSSATATWSSGSPYYWEEYHLYIGSEPLARDVNGDYTVAPGQYLEVLEADGGGETTRAITIEGLSGDVFVVAHAVSCEPGE